MKFLKTVVMMPYVLQPPHNSKELALTSALSWTLAFIVIWAENLRLPVFWAENLRLPVFWAENLRLPVLWAENLRLPVLWAENLRLPVPWMLRADHDAANPWSCHPSRSDTSPWQSEEADAFHGSWGLSSFWTKPPYTRDKPREKPAFTVQVHFQLQQLNPDCFQLKSCFCVYLLMTMMTF